MTLSLVISLALRVVLIGGIAGCVNALRRNASASERHLVWMLAIASMLILPLAASLLPPLELPSLPASPSSISRGVLHEARVSGLNWPLIIEMTWLAGSLFALINLGLAHARARKIVRRASYNAKWSRAIGRTVLVSEDSPFAFNYGTRVPAIVLPANAMEWPDQLLYATLVHEAAHIARRDSLSLFVSQLTRVLYWWHPVAWFATREAAAERERACDDAVVRSGIRPSEYGEHLLITGTGQHADPILLAAPLFSHTDGLARRIFNLLDDNVDHLPIRRRAVCASLAIALPLLVLTASATPIAQPLSPGIETLSLPPIIAQAAAMAPARTPASPIQKKSKPDRRRKLEPPVTVTKSPSDGPHKTLAGGTWIVDGRVVDAASFPVDVKEMARLARNMAQIAGKMRITIDSGRTGTTR